jgi:hypothetical protein
VLARALSGTVFGLDGVRVEVEADIADETVNGPDPSNRLTLYYHCSLALLHPGDRVRPGNWGRIIQGIGPAHSHFFREYLWERVRRDEFPDKPSRMLSAFAFTNLAAAQNYRAQEQGKNMDHIYSVRPANVEAKQQRADMSWLAVVHQYHTFDGAEECARRYWRGDDRDPNAIELLVEGELEIIDRLTPIGENGRG